MRRIRIILRQKRRKSALDKIREFSGTNTKNQLCHRLGIPKRSVNRILASEFINPSHRTFHNDPAVKEIRGRPKLITDEDLNRMEVIRDIRLELLHRHVQSKEL
jgi:hypothetical protein